MTRVPFCCGVRTVVVCLAALVCTDGATAQTPQAPAAQATVYRPLSFEPARDVPDTYVARAAGGTIAVTPNGIRARIADASSSRMVSIAFRGGAAERLVPVRRLPGVVNYLRGDRREWRTGVPTYEAIRAENVYPGISVEYYGAQGELEYDFHVAAGADARRIRLAIESPSRLKITPEGDLVDRAGRLVQRRPRSFQTIDGARREIQARYARAGDTFAVTLGQHDSRFPLVIDPVVITDVTLRGSRNELLTRAIATEDGAYVVGTTSSTDFPISNAVRAVTPGGFCNPSGDGLPPVRCRDGFIVHVNNAGAIVSSTYLGGNNVEDISDVAIDATGALYVSGVTYSNDFVNEDPNCGAFVAADPFLQLHPITGCAFVAKLAPNLASLVFVQSLPGSSGPIISLAPDGRLYAMTQSALVTLPAGAGSIATVRTFNAATERPTSVSAAPDGTVFVGGSVPAVINGFVVPDPSAALILHLRPDGGVILSAAIGTAARIDAIVPDGDSGAWMSGRTTVTGTFPFPEPTAPGTRAFLAHLSASGELDIIHDVDATIFDPRANVDWPTDVAVADAVYVFNCRSVACSTRKYDAAGNLLAQSTHDFGFPVRGRLAVSMSGRQWLAYTTMITEFVSHTDVRLLSLQWASISNFAANAALPARFNIPITWTATTNLASGLEYVFYRYDTATGWSEVQPWGPAATYTWTPGYSDVGDHALQVWTRPVGSTGSYEAWSGSEFTVTAGALPVVTSFARSSVSAAMEGAPAIWTAQASGGVGSPQYQFWRLDADGWHIVQPYSATNTYTWTPGAADVGEHALQVWVRNPDSPAPYEGWQGLTFTVSGPAPLNVTGLTASSSPSIGATTTWSTATSGGRSPLQYKFWRLDPDGWHMVQDYSAANTYSWMAGVNDAGSHALQVWVRSQGSVTAFDAWLGTGFFTVPALPPVSVAFNAQPTLPAATGTTLTWTAAANAAGVEYQYWRFDEGIGWQIVQPWSANATYSWTPTAGESGTHALQVWVRRVGSITAYDGWVGTGFFAINR